MRGQSLALISLALVASGCAFRGASEAAAPGNAATLATEPDVVVQPNSDTALGRAAKDLDILSRGKIIYSPSFLHGHPYAAGSFSREKNSIFIDKATFEHPEKESPVLRHELLHARVFGELTRRSPAPWYGYFSGGSFAPNDLFLDEPLAYRNDLIEVAKELKELLRRQAGDFDEITWREIRSQVTQRLKGEPPSASSEMSQLVRGADSMAKKLLHGGWHSYPAVGALTALPKDERLCSTAKFAQEFNVTVAQVESKFEEKKFVSTLFLSASGGVADPRNCALLQEQRASAQKFAEESSELFKQGRAELERILALPLNEAKIALERFATTSAERSLPAAGTSLRLAVPSHTSTRGKKSLREKASQVAAPSPDLFILLASLRATVAAENGVGIAAPQVGAGMRVILVRRMDITPEKPFVAYINPEIIERSVESDVDWEGCLSIPEGMGQVRRAHSIRVRALNEMGEPIEEKVEGYVARIFQHEIDHLDGILFIDRKEPGELVSKDEVRRLRQGRSK